MNSDSPKPPAVNPPAPLRIRLDTTTGDDVQVNIIPLIDVIFCILTFFILAAVGLSRQQAININLPKAETGVPQARQLLIVSLDSQGNVFVEQQPVRSKEEFMQKLVQYLQQNPNGLMSLYASPNASYDQVVQLLDILRSVGGDRVALATLPGGAPPAPNATPTINPTINPTNPQFTPTPGSGIPQNIPPSGTNPQIPGQFTPQLPGQFTPQLPGQNPQIPGQVPGQTPGNQRFSPQFSPTPSKNINPEQINPNSGP